MKTRFQHPKVNERKERTGAYWFIRYYSDELQPDGSMKTTRKFQKLGPSKGDDRLTKREAEIARDKFLVGLNVTTEHEVVAAKGLILFKEAADMYEKSHLERRNRIAAPSREKAISHLDLHILPKWGNRRLIEIRPKDVEDWLYDTFDSWWMMNAIRNLMGAIYRKAEEWGYWEEGKRCPLVKVNIGRKWYKRPRQILTMDQTVAILGRLQEPYLLIVETIIATGARISEVLGLQWRHVELDKGLIRIEQRLYHGEIGAPKTDRSRRTLTLGHLAERFRAKAKADGAKPDGWVFQRTDGLNFPIWDSTVRELLHKAAREEGCDFAGFGPHTLRRANITWRQLVGGSAIETSMIAGHSSIEMTEQYTFIDLERQDQLTQAIQDRLAAVRENGHIAKEFTATDKNTRNDGGPPPSSDGTPLATVLIQ